MTDRVFVNSNGQQYTAAGPLSTADSENLFPSPDLISILKATGRPQKVSEVQEVFTRFQTLDDAAKDSMRQLEAQQQLALAAPDAVNTATKL